MSDFERYAKEALERAEEKAEADKELARAVAEASKEWRVGPLALRFPSLYTLNEAEALGLELFPTGEDKLRDLLRKLALVEFTTAKWKEWAEAEDKEGLLERRVAEVEASLSLADVPKITAEAAAYFKALAKVLNASAQALGRGGKGGPFRADEEPRTPGEEPEDEAQ